MSRRVQYTVNFKYIKFSRKLVNSEMRDNQKPGTSQLHEKVVDLLDSLKR